jgi:hypothetical protein
MLSSLRFQTDFTRCSVRLLIGNEKRSSIQRPGIRVKERNALLSRIENSLHMAPASAPSIRNYDGKGEARAYMFVPQPIGFVSSPYKDTAEIPKGLNTKHEAEGVLKVLQEFELGLTDI